MKHLSAAGLAAFFACTITHSVLAQGSLTPPGAPAPTMKTLDQLDAKLEKRIPISSLPFTISNPGSYYVTTNLTGGSSQNGIVVSTSDVAIDLNGYALTGLSNSLAAFTVSGVRSNIAVRNGIVCDWPSGGVSLGSVATCRLEDLSVRNCGSGIFAGDNSVIADCVAVANGTGGISAGADSVVMNCTSRTNRGHGIAVGNSSTVVACTSMGNTNVGIYLSSGTSAERCAARNNGLDGIIAVEGNSIRGCVATFNGRHGISGNTALVASDCSVQGNGVDGINGGQMALIQQCIAIVNQNDGIEVSFGSLVSGNICRGNGPGANDGAGIHVTGIDNRIEANTATFNDRGLDVDAANNLIIRNSARNNSTEFDILAGNSLGPIITGANMSTNSNPHANYQF